MGGALAFGGCELFGLFGFFFFWVWGGEDDFGVVSSLLGEEVDEVLEMFELEI